MLRILGAIYLSSPTTAPAQLLVLKHIPTCSTHNHRYLPQAVFMALRSNATSHLLPCNCLPVHPTFSRDPISSHQQVTGTKAELMLRILGAFNLSSPTTGLDELLRALVLERSPAGSRSLHWGGPGSRAWNNKILDARGGIYHANPAAGTVVGTVRCRQRHSRRAQGMRVSLACLLRCGSSNSSSRCQ
jgi:hypothetical protein